MDLQTTKSQTITLMVQELNAIEKQCECYQHVVEKLTRQVETLTKKIHLMDQRSVVREGKLLHQLNELQDTLRHLQ